MMIKLKNVIIHDTYPMVILLDRELHILELEAIEEKVCEYGLPFNEFGAYSFGPYFHIRICHNVNHAIKGKLVDKADVVINLTSDIEYRRVKMDVISITPV